MTQQGEPSIWVKKNNPAFFKVYICIMRAYVLRSTLAANNLNLPQTL